jgi:hypothetical protein
VKIYWDTSALVWFYSQGRIPEIAGYTRPRSLAEAFSALTGAGFALLLPGGSKIHKRLSPRAAETIIGWIQPRLTYVEITANDILTALHNAQAKAVQGGRVHDPLHSTAAEKCGADELWTLDKNDFIGPGRVPLKDPSQMPK